MAHIRHWRGNTAENNARVGKPGLITHDTEGKALRVYDGETPGGLVIPGTKVELPTVPGPTELQAGDDTVGFYGEVSTDDLIDGEALASEVGLSAGVAFNTTAPWLKMSYNGRVLMVGKRACRHSLSWSSLYHAGIVYGTDDVGVSPIDGGVLQDTQLVIAGYTYRVRLLKMFDNDPVSNEPMGGDLTAVFGSLLNTWRIYALSELNEGGANIGNACWVQETPESSPNGRYLTSSGQFDDSAVKSIDYQLNYSGWRPVLELIA